MATAATSLLGLALPVTGELSGTWGDTVNVSITALLDTAVAGTTTLSSDADVTLTTTTLAANQARQAIILWTAGGTVTRTITVPAQSKSYIVINKTSSSQSIKIVGVGPTTGVTIVAGTAAFVVWNGVDFVTASVTSTTGILPVANGGTGLSSGTSGGVLAYTAAGTLASSAALAASALVIGGGAGAAPSTTTTGTGVVTALGVNTGTAGAFVVNGGALGTPASGTVTNLTGTASININGTVGATTANTGAFSTVTATGTISGGTSGTGYSFSGSAPATSLTLDSSGNLILGAANPNFQGSSSTGSATLINNSGGAFVRVYGGSHATKANYTEFINASSTSAFDSAGNLGIGTSSPSSKLDVVSSGDAARFGNTKKLYISTDSAGYGLFSAANQAGTGIYASDTSSFIYFATASTERARIDSSGNLLVGVTTANANGGVLQLKSGITFPATAVAATDANTLDDYEEGTWTVAGALVTPGTSSNANAVGFYTKVGNLVTISGAVDFTKGTGTGALTIGALPFTASNTANAFIPVNVLPNAAGAALNLVSGYISPNGTTITIVLVPQSTAGLANLSDTALAAVATIRFTVSYRV